MPGDQAPGSQGRILDNKEVKATQMVIVLDKLQEEITNNWRNLDEDSIVELTHQILDVQAELMKRLPPNK